ncbi:MAG: porin family protein [Chitinophagaceae bacterium]
MKKLSLLITAVLISSALLAQTGAVFGLKGGINLANWNTEGDEDGTDMKTGFHVGGLAHIHLAPQWALQPELQFSTQGAEADLGPLGEYTWNLSYLNVPVMVQYMFNNGFRLEAGPYVGFLVGANLEDDAGNEDDVDDEFKKVDVGVGFGLNYLTNSGFGFGGRYNLGLSDINEERTNKIQNRVFQISVFYMFDAAHKAKSQ